ncbi:carbamoyl-phosphate synthase large subunit [bacterium]|nr:carbamoyl-phosphate synthase large subunit [bacterium]
MPKRTDIRKILVIGSGPVVIGEGGAFDYIAAQACRALKEEGYEIVIADSNPSTITTDPNLADKTYIEPLTCDSITKIIEIEKPDALLASVGGRSALNLAMALESNGALAKHSVTMIGMNTDVLSKCDDLSVAASAGAKYPIGKTVCSMEEGMQVIRQIKFPAILRPSGVAGGAGSSITYNLEEFGQMLAFALKTSPVRQVLIEKPYIGWKNIEFEVLRDSNGRSVTISGMESIDPTGVHSGDSAMVYPIQTMSDAQIEKLSELSKKIADTSGLVGSMSIGFAVEPSSGEIVVMDIDPIATRFTALVSKAAGVPIAKISAKLALGVGLDEITVAGKPCSEFVPPSGYVAVKMSRFDFEKFPDADTTLGTSMKSVGVAMAFGRDFKEALQKAVRSLETGHQGMGADGRGICPSADQINEALARPNPERLFFVRCALSAGMTDAEICEITRIDPYFISQIQQLLEFEKKLAGKSLVAVTSETLLQAKQLGYSDAQLAVLLETDEEQVRTRRKVLGICSGYDSAVNMLYSTYEPKDNSVATSSDKKVIIIGGGPDRIGQGIDFGYCLVHASLALTEAGYESIIINPNPEAVSTDPDLSSRLYFEPLESENVLSIIDRERPMGVIISFSGRAASRLKAGLSKAGVNILGTSIQSIEQACKGDAIGKLGIKQTESGTAISLVDALNCANKIGYPALARCADSIRIVYDDSDITAFVQEIGNKSLEKPLVIAKFIEGAIKVDSIAVSDGKDTVICGVMEHIEQAGVHSGDSASSLPPYSLTQETIEEIKQQTRQIALELDIKGLMSAQFAIKDGEIYVLGVNPMACRMVPFVCKATGIDWTEVATKIAIGKSLKDQGISEIEPKRVCVKEAVFPFTRYPGVDVVLGPEMKSTGEVMGINETFGAAYIKAEIAAGQLLPDKGTVFMSVADADKDEAVEIARKLNELGFEIVATRGTAKSFKSAGLSVRTVYKIGEGRPDATDLIKNEEIDLIINTPSGKKPRQHEITIRSAVVARGIPIITTIAGAKATIFGMRTIRDHHSIVRSIQDYK